MKWVGFIGWYAMAILACYSVGPREGTMAQRRGCVYPAVDRYRVTRWWLCILGCKIDLIFLEIHSFHFNLAQLIRFGLFGIIRFINCIIIFIWTLNDSLWSIWSEIAMNVTKKSLPIVKTALDNLSYASFASINGLKH